MQQQAKVKMLFSGHELPATVWTNGERNRRPRIEFCTDYPDTEKGVAYLTASDANGTGITIWLQTPDDICEATLIVADSDKAIRKGLPPAPIYAAPAFIYDAREATR